jgi:hypothetical protein
LQTGLNSNSLGYIDVLQGLGGVGDGMMLMPEGGVSTADMTGVVVVPTIPQNGDQNLQDDLAVSDDSEEDEERNGDDGGGRHHHQQGPPPDGDDVMAF